MTTPGPLLNQANIDMIIDRVAARFATEMTVQINRVKQEIAADVTVQINRAKQELGERMERQTESLLAKIAAVDEDSVRRLCNLRAGTSERLLVPHHRGTAEEVVLGADYWSAEGVSIRKIVDADRDEIDDLINCMGLNVLANVTLEERKILIRKQLGVRTE